MNSHFHPKIYLTGDIVRYNTERPTRFAIYNFSSARQAQSTAFLTIQDDGQLDYRFTDITGTFEGWKWTADNVLSYNGYKGDFACKVASCKWQLYFQISDETPVSCPANEQLMRVTLSAFVTG